MGAKRLNKTTTFSGILRFVDINFAGEKVEVLIGCPGSKAKAPELHTINVEQAQKIEGLSEYNGHAKKMKDCVFVVDRWIINGIIECTFK
ncbi:MAG: hypothetical protein LBT50_09805 [Prevotellaceae bacterium]|nr:hypothetical protein [Prevotellaceae bacterium]